MKRNLNRLYFVFNAIFPVPSFLILIWWNSILKYVIEKIFAFSVQPFISSILEVAEYYYFQDLVEGPIIRWASQFVSSAYINQWCTMRRLSFLDLSFFWPVLNIFLGSFSFCSCRLVKSVMRWPQFFLNLIRMVQTHFGWYALWYLRLKLRLKLFKYFIQFYVWRFLFRPFAGSFLNTWITWELERCFWINIWRNLLILRHLRRGAFLYSFLGCCNRLFSTVHSYKLFI